MPNLLLTNCFWCMKADMKKFRSLITLLLCWSIAFQVLAATGSTGCRHEPQMDHSKHAMMHHTRLSTPATSAHAGHHHAPCTHPDHTGCKCDCYCAGVCLHVCHSIGITVSLEITAQPVVEHVFPTAISSSSSGYCLPLYHPPTVS